MVNVALSVVIVFDVTVITPVINHVPTFNEMSAYVVGGAAPDIAAEVASLAIIVYPNCPVVGESV